MGDLVRDCKARSLPTSFGANKNALPEMDFPVDGIKLALRIEQSVWDAHVVSQVSLMLQAFEHINDVKAELFVDAQSNTQDFC